MEFTEFLKAWKEYKKFENEPDEEVKEEPKELPKEEPKELPKEEPKDVRSRAEQLPKDEPKDNEELTNALKKIEELEKELRRATSRQKLSDRTEEEIKGDESLIDDLFNKFTIF